MSSDVFWWHSSENLSPKVSPAFLERQRRILVPAQFAREHQNSWVDAADGFTSAAEVDAAMAHGWTEQIDGRPGTDYISFVDLGATHDPSVIAVGHVEGDLAYIDVLRTFQGSRDQPVQIVVVEETLRDLARRFNLTRIRVESWQGLSAVQSLQRAGLPVELFAPTAKAHADEWPVLAQRLASRTLVLFPHARLREELLGLVVELGAAGVRVIDRGQVHQDHAVAVRGVVASFARRGRRVPRLDRPERQGARAGAPGRRDAVALAGRAGRRARRDDTDRGARQRRDRSRVAGAPAHRPRQNGTPRPHGAPRRMVTT
jgi:hypothetical protein